MDTIGRWRGCGRRRCRDRVCCQIRRLGRPIARRCRRRWRVRGICWRGSRLIRRGVRRWWESCRAGCHCSGGARGRTSRGCRPGLCQSLIGTVLHYGIVDRDRGNECCGEKRTLQKHIILRGLDPQRFKRTGRWPVPIGTGALAAARTYATPLRRVKTALHRGAGHRPKIVPREIGEQHTIAGIVPEVTRRYPHRHNPI